MKKQQKQPTTIFQMLIKGVRGMDSKIITQRNASKKALKLVSHLLSKGYTLDDFVEPLIHKYGNYQSVPDTRTDAGTNIDGNKIRDLFELVIPKTPHGWGICLFAFPLGEPDVAATYISNANRDDMIVSLRHLASTMEARKEIPPPTDN